jgi:NADH-quinone oxidoreductase subunit J
MTGSAILFYALGAVILSATGFAITRRNMVHAVVSLIISFLGTAVLFSLLGAPFLAILEVVIYAGAIMVLFLFVIMMLRPEQSSVRHSFLRGWGPGLLVAGAFLVSLTLIFFRGHLSSNPLEIATVMPAVFGRIVFQKHWLAVEIISFLLLVALVAAIQLGRGKEDEKGEDTV